MAETQKFATQNIILENRTNLTVTGVLSVESFDETEIVTKTENGVLNLRGENIKIGSYNEEIGEICATGDFYAAIYVNDTVKKGGLINRIFK